jgi:hypothetical protein
MNKAFRTALSLVFSLVLFSALTTAHTGGNSAERETNREHHSRLAKVAFWRHHKNAKQAQVSQARSKPAQERAQINPASAKQKALAANKTKPRHKTQDPKTASVKQ